MPKITAIITAYNLEHYLDRCFRQIFAQTFQDFDVLIVDDCSTDDTRGIISRWQTQRPGQIRSLLLKKNLGMPAKARNAALESGLIDGECFLFLDGDDAIETELLEKLYGALTEQDADVAICAYDRVEEQTGRVLCTEMQGFTPVVEMPPRNDLLAFINTAPWNKLWRTAVFGDGRFPPFRVGEEVVVQFTRYACCRRLAFVDDVLIHYSVRAGSVISNTTETAIRDFAEELQHCYEVQYDPVLRDTLGLMAFLHIGISMAIRAMDNPAIDLRQHLHWTRQYLFNTYGGLRGNRFLRLSSLRRHGIKGLLLWVSLIAYRLRCFGLVLRSYHVLSRLLHLDIKF